MKKCFIVIGLLIATIYVQAQQTQGMVTYERTTQMQIRIAGLPEGMESQLPKSRTDIFELTFDKSKTLWKAAEQDMQEEHSGGGDGLQVRTVVAGSNDVLFTDLESGKKVERKEIFDKTFLVDDTINKLKWKMTGETKTILNMPCMKATSSLVRKRTQMTMDNGKMERKEIEDTANIIAWFTTSIPVTAGPGEYQGQLPGLILEMDIKDGTQVFKALSISEKADLTVIKEPSGKKRYTADEFKKEREKLMDEMQKNMGGGMRVIRGN
jgi:GLPGLI family protein